MGSCANEDFSDNITNLNKTNLTYGDVMSFEEAIKFFSRDEIELLNLLNARGDSLKFFKVIESEKGHIPMLTEQNVANLLSIKEDLRAGTSVIKNLYGPRDLLKTRSESGDHDGKIMSYEHFIDSYSAFSGTIKIYAYFGYKANNGTIELLSFNTGMKQIGLMSKVYWDNRGSAASAKGNAIDYNVVGAIVGRLEGSGGVGAETVLKYISDRGRITP